MLRSTLGFMLPPATAGWLKAFVHLARSQAAGKTLLKKQEVANLLRRLHRLKSAHNNGLSDQNLITGGGKGQGKWGRGTGKGEGGKVQ
jgi:hypothetical protein